MIKSIKLTNFFSFKEEEINLNQQANILIGVNGSGKSNLFKAILLLKVGVEGNADDSALRELIVNNWGGFDNIYCKAITEGTFQYSIGLEFKLDGEKLSSFGPMRFHDDITYKIIIVKKPSTDNYYVSEKISSPNYIYLNFTNGSGHVSERLHDGDSPAIQYTQYNDYNPQELALSKISEFDKDRYLPLVVIKRAIKDIAIYTYFDTTPSSKLRRAMSATSGTKKLLPDGSNLPQILNSIKINNKTSYKIIQSKVKDVNEMFAGFDFNFLGSGVFELMLDEDELNSSVHITHVSDGTLRYLCLLSILYNPDRGSLICIDEPEVGLHPDMLYNISNAINNESENTTFLIASHSENVLNGFNIDNVRVFEKDESNCTKVKAFSEKDFEGWYEAFSPGSMWREGDLGGKRW